MIMRASWKGSIGFGMVNIPVSSAPVVGSENDLSFHRFRRTQMQVKGKKKPVEKINPVGNQNFDKVTGEIIEFADVIRGYTASNGAVVEVTDDDLAAVARQRNDRIEIEKFVPAADIDPLYLDKSEWAWPRDKGSQKPYATLVAALQRTGMAGIGRTVRRGKERVYVVSVIDGALVLTSLHWAEDVRPVPVKPTELPEPNPGDVDMAQLLVQTLAGKWEPGEFQDSYRAELTEALEAKAAGKAPEPAKPGELAEQLGDLMATLKASVEAASAKRKK